MNKLERNLKGRQKWIKRLKALGLWNKGNPEKFTYCWKHQGKPCSCFMCSPQKFNRKDKHKKNLMFEGDIHIDFFNQLHND